MRAAIHSGVAMSSMRPQPVGVVHAVQRAVGAQVIGQDAGIPAAAGQPFGDRHARRHLEELQRLQRVPVGIAGLVLVAARGDDFRQRSRCYRLAWAMGIMPVSSRTVASKQCRSVAMGGSSMCRVGDSTQRPTVPRRRQIVKRSSGGRCRAAPPRLTDSVMPGTRCGLLRYRHTQTPRQEKTLWPRCSSPEPRASSATTSPACAWKRATRCASW